MPGYDPDCWVCACKERRRNGCKRPPLWPAGGRYDESDHNRDKRCMRPFLLPSITTKTIVIVVVLVLALEFLSSIPSKNLRFPSASTKRSSRLSLSFFS